MPQEFTTPPEIPDAGKEIGQIGQGSVPNARVEAQLNQPNDISQAHQFFSAKTGAGLPNISFGDGGASVGTAGSIPHGIMPGGEHAMAMPAGGTQVATMPADGGHSLGLLNGSMPADGGHSLGLLNGSMPADGGHSLGLLNGPSAESLAAMPGAHVAALPTDGGHSLGLLNGPTPGAESLAAMPTGGAEHALSVLPTGGEHAMTLMAGPTPGMEQGVSPLIQMLMKLPGLTGVLDNIFEFLKSFFEGDLMESLTSALLDPTGLMMHLFQEAGDGFTMSIDMVKNASPLLSFKDGMMMPGDYSAMNMHSDLAGSASDAGNVGAPIQNVDMQDAIFERTSNYTITEHHQGAQLEWHRGSEQMAIDPQGVYKPSMSTYSAPTTPTTPSGLTAAHAGPPTQHAAPAHHAGGHDAAAGAHHQTAHHDGGHAAHHSDAGHVQHHQAAHHDGAHRIAHHGSSHQIGNHQYKVHDVNIHDNQIAQANDASATPGQYQVQSGDSLWDIARRQLGDGSRWGEIYRLNADTIGQNPNLIFSGTTLHMPGGESIASAIQQPALDQSAAASVGGNNFVSSAANGSQVTMNSSSQIATGQTGQTLGPVDGSEIRPETIQ